MCCYPTYPALVMYMCALTMYTPHDDVTALQITVHYPISNVMFLFPVIPQLLNAYE